MSAQNLLPIEPDSELCQVLSSLPEKFVVDFANGIDVVRDHIRVQHDRTAFFSRMYDGFTGQGLRRQAEINASLADGVEGALTWLTELTESFAQSNFALARVNERVALIQIAIGQLANYSADTRSQIAILSQNLNSRMDRLSEELYRVAAVQRAERQLEQVFNKWAAGRFAAFSCAGRCYAALEELRWGAFGDFCRDSRDTIVRKSFIDDLANRAIQQLVADMELDGATMRPSVDNWLANPNCRVVIAGAPEALAYLGDWASSESHPFVFTTTQRPATLPTPLPRFCSAERVAEALVSEIFD